MDQLYIWSVGVGGRLGMLCSNWVTISIDMHGNGQIGGPSLRGSDEIIGICACVRACVSVCMCMEGAGECGAGRYIMLDRLRVLDSVSLMSWALPDV